MGMGYVGGYVQCMPYIPYVPIHVHVPYASPMFVMSLFASAKFA
jgi:hypothetical protein